MYLDGEVCGFVLDIFFVVLFLYSNVCCGVKVTQKQIDELGKREGALHKTKHNENGFTYIPHSSFERKEEKRKREGCERRG